MPWEDIEKCCFNALQHAGRQIETTSQRLEKHLGFPGQQPSNQPFSQQHLEETVALPHSEETLALLVHVHVKGGSKDLAQHLSGLTMRAAVIQQLISI
jgi:hypothetical protein